MGWIMKLTKIKREALRMKFGGCCAFCGDELPARGWHAEQIGEQCVPGGIAAVCTECHSSRGNATPEAFRDMLAEQVERAQRHSINFRMALRFGLVSQTCAPVEFWYERCSAERSPTLRLSSDSALNNNSAA